MRPLLVIGDALLDRDVVGDVHRLCPDAPVPVLDEREARARPGGAALAAALAAADGREVTLLSALGDDEAGRLLVRLLAGWGVELVDLGLHGATPEKVRLRNGGRSLLRLDRGGKPSRIGELSAAGRAAIGWADAILVADYGRGLTSQPAVRAALRDAAVQKPLVWDPHVRGATPVAGVEVATPNESEAVAFAAGAGSRASIAHDAGIPDLASMAHDAGVAGCASTAPVGAALERIGSLAADLAHDWRARHVCVTCGEAGGVLSVPGAAHEIVAAPRVSDGDACGAGDRFSSALAGALADGEGVTQAVRKGVAQASAFVAAGAAGAFAAGKGRARGQAGVSPRQELRAWRRGRIVATGGCFDLLHSGHVRTLQSARALGDHLIVCLNSDASVRRLKGPARPVVRQADRAAVLRALESVGEVVIFDEDTPNRVLERIRPDVWVKGGDYAGQELPEAAVLARWGGRVVTLPYIDGHSTTRLLEEVACRVAI